jgi:ADP-ribose pyrophosphatase YjhB (NUDIX family)
MDNNINNFADRLRPAGILYVDVYPYRIADDGSVRFLLLRRRDDVPLPGQWQAVSGKIAVGESIADAFVRQVQRKTGQAAAQVAKLAAVATFYDEYYDTVVLVPGAAAELSSEVVQLDNSLHVEARWTDVEEAQSLLPWPGQHNIRSQ